ncbi:hypothetical protein ABIA00_003240 [Bradyrhizobium ottawaense]|uniref:hypothetical protein n=1 Tax=Bradyrhizobium ottawaense TaxID=931866 RepID=UPI0038389E65
MISRTSPTKVTQWASTGEYISKGPYGHIIAPEVRAPLPAPAAAADQPVVKTLN